MVYLSALCPLICERRSRGKGKRWRRREGKRENLGGLGRQEGLNRGAGAAGSATVAMCLARLCELLRERKRTIEVEERSGLVRLASGPGEVKTVPAWEFYQEEGGCEVVSGLGTRTSGLDDDAHGTGARRLESR